MTETMREVLTQEDLDPMGCDTPNCTHDHSVLFFHAACHPQARVEACYRKQSGTIVIACARCKKFVCEVQVAERRQGLSSSAYIARR